MLAVSVKGGTNAGRRSVREPYEPGEHRRALRQGSQLVRLGDVGGDALHPGTWWAGAGAGDDTDLLALAGQDHRGG